MQYLVTAATNGIVWADLPVADGTAHGRTFAVLHAAVLTKDDLLVDLDADTAHGTAGELG